VSRLRLGEVTALIGAGALIASLFVRHYENAAGNLSIWDTFGPAAALLLSAICGALMMVVAALSERDSPALPVSTAVWSVLLGLLGFVAALIRVFERPEHATMACIGVWLALAGATLVLIGSWWTVRDERPSRYPPARPQPRPQPRAD
jgi:drug/metabolite transporter (DMT)-like permease